MMKSDDHKMEMKVDSEMGLLQSLQFTVQEK